MEKESCNYESGNIPYIDDSYLVSVDYMVAETKVDEGDFTVAVPLNLSAELIMDRLRIAYLMLGFVDERNEYYYSSIVRNQLTAQLELYDKLMMKKYPDKVIETEENVKHSPEGRKLAEDMVKFMMENEGCAELFPYDEVEYIESIFGTIMEDDLY